MSDEQKAEVGRAVCEYLTSGMKLGIGTGSTAEAFVRALAKRVENGLEIIGVPTSERTRILCEQLGIPLTTLDQTPQLDLTIDGADEVDKNLALTKGGGGALLREKIVAAASNSMYVIADESKIVEYLGMFPLPIEVNLFGLTSTSQAIENIASSLNLSGHTELRKEGDLVFTTDGGHAIIDASFGHIRDADALSHALLAIPGVVQHGLFIDMATKVFIAGENGVRILEKE